MKFPDDSTAGGGGGNKTTKNSVWWGSSGITYETTKMNIEKKCEI